MELDKVVVVKKLTQLEELLARHATTTQARFHLESRGASYDDYKAAHDAYHAGLSKVLSVIPRSLRTQVLEREMLTTYQTGERDLIVAVGDPGLVVNVAKYVKGQPIIAVNPDAKRFDDTLATCEPDEFHAYLTKALEGNATVQRLTMAQATLEDGQTILALNDIFIGRRTHVSAKYEINAGGKKEQQSSSGIITSTGTGSTGWMTSIMRGAESLTKSEKQTDVPFARDKPYLLFAVREPFPSKATGASIVYGRITEASPLVVRSNMPEDGAIFSDGIEQDYLSFNSGSIAIIKPASMKATLVLP